jgi:hypothetical protein
MDVVAARTLNILYIYLDTIWLLSFSFLLIWRKKYIAFLAGIAGGIIYFIVDYGIFYLLLHTRVVTGADPLLFLLWLSMSYGLTNFAWIWLLLDRDRYQKEWSILIIIAWLAIAVISQNYGTGFEQISIQRGTAYHGIFAIMLAVGYIWLIIQNFKSNTEKRINILRLLAIGIGIQFSWEAVLLVSGIRPTGVMPLVINSLVETNMGLPYLYMIHKAISSRFTEDFKKFFI